MNDSLSDVPENAPRPPAAEIPGAIAQTEHALGALTDWRRFERIAIACLQEFEPSLRNTGGSGDQQRDGVGGPLRADDDKLIVTVSVEERWDKKIERDLDGLAEHGHKPELVVAVTNRPTGAKRRNALEEARSKRGYKLRIIDVEYLALRLLSPELLAVREELLGLPPPRPPVAVDADEFARRQPDVGAPDALIGRAGELDELVSLLGRYLTVEVTGPGGIGKTRLVLEAASRTGADRVLFLDDRARLDVGRLATELAGADRLVLAVDNAHRREDLHQIIGLLLARTGPTELVLIARPGYDERLRQARDGTPFGAPDATGRLVVGQLGNKSIGELVRAAEPKLEFEGAIEQIIYLAAGNPLIALLGHKVASSRGGLHGLVLNDLLDEYARSAVAAAVARRTDVHADDLNDVLVVIAVLGSVGPSDEELIASLLDVPVRAVRHRIADLADSGLLTASGERLAIVPDLLAAQLLHYAYLSGKTDTGVRYQEIWEAAGDKRHDAMCSALGALQGFDVTPGAEVIAFVGDALVDLAAAAPARALARAQSAAPGLPNLAVRVVDAALASLPSDPAAREAALLVAMDVLSRVPDVAAGWPRQLAVAEAFFAAPGSDAAETKIRDGLTEIYKRLPVNTSVYDGYVLARVQEVLAESTECYWKQRRNLAGCAQAMAVAAGQLLTVVSERSYMSAEDDRLMKLSAGFLPAGERTATVLRAGSRLLRESLPHLELAAQHRAIDPISRLRRTAGGFAGPFGSSPGEDLVALARVVIDETAQELTPLGDLPLPTRAGLVRALGSNPWPEDEELRAFRELLMHEIGDRRAWDRATRGERSEQQAAALLAADDCVAELRRWQGWIDLAGKAGMRHLARGVVDRALAIATTREPEAIAKALEEVLGDGGPLCDLIAPALAELVTRPDGEGLARRLLAGAPAATRAAIAGGLVGAPTGWADDLLDALADDEDRKVRSAVAHTAGWTRDRSAHRLRIGLRACLPGDLDGALTVLGGARALAADDDAVMLDAEAAVLLARLVTNAACAPRLDGTELVEIGEMAGQPRLIIDACLARVQWLADHPAGDLTEMMARDSLPDEIAEAARSGAADVDRIRLMDLLEDPALGGEARSAATTLLAWIDDHDLVTDRLGRWLASDEERLHYLASELLRTTRDPQLLKERARTLLTNDPPLDLTDVLLEAREPVWFVGSEKVVFRRLVDEFETWAEDSDERLAAIGRAGVERFQARSETDGEFDDDDDPEWG